ncbi:hypothetical protein OTU49_011753 [Cherax quadricarinatus]|uniref:Group XIIA secretory phospholipase A2 n=1 Tax=Cherax quadricarinatus TaxID=27406 RepID=A0AAW0W4N9_CHEQU|nr:group XIIA secretory phospholipase A2-like [Cherax quadricarinatus]
MMMMLVVTLMTLMSVVCGQGYFDALYNNMMEAQETLREVAIAVNKGLNTITKTVKYVENIIDATVEEECIYKCKNNKIPVHDNTHKPQANGCGSFGVFFEKEDLSRPEMVDCCNDHDICYDTCGSNKEECDLRFRRCLYSTCEVNQHQMDTLTYTKCKGGAKLLYTATMALGCTSYKEAQHGACRCVSPQDLPQDRSEL